MYSQNILPYFVIQTITNAAALIPFAVPSPYPPPAPISWKVRKEAQRKVQGRQETLHFQSLLYTLFLG